MLLQRELNQYLVTLVHVPALLQAAKWQWDGGAVVDVLQKALACKKMGEEASNSLLQSTTRQKLLPQWCSWACQPHLIEMTWMAPLSCSVFTPLHEPSCCCEACAPVSPSVLSTHCWRVPEWSSCSGYPTCSSWGMSFVARHHQAHEGRVSTGGGSWWKLQWTALFFNKFSISWVRVQRHFYACMQIVGVTLQEFIF